jgi:hypothetical protein
MPMTDAGIVLVSPETLSSLIVLIRAVTVRRASSYQTASHSSYVAKE